jgi:hypothetical protein
MSMVYNHNNLDINNEEKINIDEHESFVSKENSCTFFQNFKLKTISYKFSYTILLFI